MDGPVSGDRLGRVCTAARLIRSAVLLSAVSTAHGPRGLGSHWSTVSHLLCGVFCKVFRLAAHPSRRPCICDGRLDLVKGAATIFLILASSRLCVQSVQMCTCSMALPIDLLLMAVQLKMEVLSRRRALLVLGSRLRGPALLRLARETAKHLSYAHQNGQTSSISQR